MFLNSFWLQTLIVVIVVILFIASFIINKRTKIPKGVELPDKCKSCTSNSCLIKSNDIDKVKEELKEYLEKGCEENDEK